jgi:hypothetical protein
MRDHSCVRPNAQPLCAVLFARVAVLRSSSSSCVDDRISLPPLIQHRPSGPARHPRLRQRHPLATNMLPPSPPREASRSASTTASYNLNNPNSVVATTARRRPPPHRTTRPSAAFLPLRCCSPSSPIPCSSVKIRRRRGLRSLTPFIF